MEPFPDQFTRDTSGEWATYSKISLKKMMEAIIDAVAEAAKNGKKLHVTIASEDNDLITRLKSAYGKQQEILKQEDESDSDSDEAELMVDPAFRASALAKLAEE